MPNSEAQKKANAKYLKEKVRAFQIRFYPTDADLLEWFEAQPEKTQYLKQLIRADMERRSAE